MGTKTRDNPRILKWVAGPSSCIAPYAKCENDFNSRFDTNRKELIRKGYIIGNIKEGKTRYLYCQYHVEFRSNILAAFGYS